MKSSRIAVLAFHSLCLPLLLAACGRGPAGEAAVTEPAPAVVELLEGAETSESMGETGVTATLARPTATPTASHTATPLPPTASPQPTATEPPPVTPTLVPFPTDLSLEEIAAELEGLSMDDFFEVSYRHLLVRNPEFLTEVGLAETLGLRNDRLNDLSQAAAEERYQLHGLILDRLRGYDREGLTSQQQISYDVYEWYLDDLIRDYAFRDHHYLIRHFYSGYHANLDRLFSELHPLDDQEDAQDFIARLAQVDTQVDQVISALRRSQAAGIVLPRFSLHYTRRQLVDMLQMSGDDPSTIRRAAVPVFTQFSERLTLIESLSSDERVLLREAALEEIEQSYIPALLALIDMVDEQLLAATDDDGIWKLPDGEAFYAHLLRRETTTDLTAAEIHQIGLEEVDRIHGEMRAVFQQLGYPAEAELDVLIPRAIEEAGHVPGGMEGAVAEYEAILAEIDEKLDEVLDVRPQMELVVVAHPGLGGYYTPGSVDGSRPAAFHAGVGESGLSRFEMATVAYHEAVPGHHLQDALAKEMDLPTFRNITFFNGYGEGWALYAERLAWELGLFADDPYGNLGRLYMELLRAVRMVADTGIHTQGWTREEARAYITEVMGGDRWSGEVDRYIVWPAQSTEYKTGMMKILELRQRAMEALGEDYDPKAFHRVVLLNGALPLTFLERAVDDYIAAARGQ